MRRVIPCIGVCLFLVAAAESAFAQQRLFVRMPSEVVELDSRQPSLGAVIRRFPVPEEPGLPTYRDTVAFGGGRFLAWAGRGVLVLDTLSGAVQRFTFPGFFPTRVIGTDGNARVVVLDSGLQNERVLVADARSGRVHVLDLGPQPMVRSIAYAAASDALFVEKRRTPTPSWGDNFNDVDVIHAATGALLKTFDISPAYAGHPSQGFVKLSVNTAGTRLFVTDVSTGTFVFDVASGTPSASNRSLVSLRSVLDENRNRLLAPDYGIAAFSADSLGFLGQVSVPELPLPSPNLVSGVDRTRELDVSGLSATIFVLDGLGGYLQSGRFCQSQLLALEVDTGRVRQTIPTTDALGIRACELADLIRVTEPAPPAALTAEVVGHQVTMRWHAPFDATEYEVEAGAAPGLANIATRRVTDPQLVVDGVPTGAYYVRVRAVNSIGKSGASQEVQVIVP